MREKHTNMFLVSEMEWSIQYAHNIKVAQILTTRWEVLKTGQHCNTII